MTEQPSAPTERKLAAIMFTDIVGYTALMAESEEKGLRVRARHRELVRPLVERYHGESIEARGDESLSVFPSALDAVNCALAIQNEVRDEPELKLHLGIHLGDLVVQGGEVSGDGVNIASRLCALSEGGGLCVSGEVYRSVRNQPGIDAVPRGERELKNVPEPVAVYAVSGKAAPPRAVSETAPESARRAVRALAWVGAAVAVIALGIGWWLYRPAGDLSPIRSIAVLPLENLSGDPEQEYFADGMTEALIGDLAKIGSLRVISRTSIMQYKGKRKPLPEIARELDVDGVVEGTVMRAGDRVRITAQLIDARDDRHLWAERFDRDLRDVLALHSEVARAVAREIELKLTPQEGARLNRAPTVDRQAHEAYLKARYEAARFTAAGFEKAIEHYRHAIDEDPRHARAYEGLADAYLLWAQPLMAFPHHEAMPRAKAAARMALEIDDSLAEAQAAIAAVEWLYDWDFSKADRDFRRAIELNPGSSRAHRWYAIYLSAMGRHREAIQQHIRAAELDPLSLAVGTAKAESFYHAREYERAIEQCQKVLGVDPDYQRAHHVLTWVYAQLGRYEEAIAASQAEEGLSGEELATLQRSFAASGPVGYWRWRLARFQEAAPRGYVDPSMTAEFYGRLGEKEAMFEWLERAYEARDGGLTFLRVDPQWDPWRSEPRFQDLLRRIGFPES